MITVQKRNFENYIYPDESNAKKTIYDRDKEGESYKNIEINKLITDPDLFGAFCMAKKSQSTYAIDSREDQEDFERIRCISAQSFLAGKDFKIYVIPITPKIVYLRKKPEEQGFHIVLSNDGRVSNIVNIESLETICDVAGFTLSKTQENHKVLINNGPTPLEKEIQVLNFEWKNADNLPQPVNNSV